MARLASSYQKRRPPGRHPGAGLARALSKSGFCSRSRAAELILAGRVRVNGSVRREPGWPVELQKDNLEVDGKPIGAADKVYLMINKPRGIITTASDEKGRPTVFACLPPGLPFLAPVGRLDQASEGLLLFTNDTPWAAALTDPATHVDKTYHVQVDQVLDERLIERLRTGVSVGGDLLKAKAVTQLRHGTSTCWLEIVLDEGKNRHIRRLLEAVGSRVLRLVRVAIGPLPLGALPKGAFRHLTSEEVRALRVRHAPTAEQPTPPAAAGGRRR